MELNIDEIKHFKLDEMKTTVDPEMAKKLMSNNESNRDFRVNRSKHYARQMKLGRWGASPEPLVITDKGRAVSLQHRLSAVIDTGIPQEFTICVIKDEDFDRVFDIIDQHAPRSSSDVLRLDNKIIKPINFLLRSCGINTPTAEDLRPFCDSDLGRLLQLMSLTKKSGKVWRHNNFKAAMAASILTNTINEQEAFTIYDDLNSKMPNEWPHIFAALYMQLTDNSKPLYISGRSLESSWFIRSFFAFQHYKDNTKTIRINKGFVKESETRVLACLQNINPSFLD
jgi:hypothetical protein